MTTASGAVRLPTITVGQLRQNPTAMIHDVRLGQEYILTDRGVPTARIVPYREHRWVSAASVSDLLNTAVNGDWLREVRQLRESVDMTDPWTD